MGTETVDQKQSRLDISRYLLSRYEDDPGDSIERVVTQDETWVHHFDPAGIFLSILGRDPRAFLNGKISDANPDFGKFSEYSKLTIFSKLTYICI